MGLWDGYYADGTSAGIVLRRDEPTPEGIYHNEKIMRKWVISDKRECYDE